MSQPLLVNDANASQCEAETAVETAAPTRTAKNEKFVQLRRDSIKPLSGLMRRSGVSAHVLLCLAADMSVTNDIAYGVEALELETGASRSSLFEALARLEREKWIKKVTDSAGTFYRVNSRVFWTSSKNYLSGSFSDALEIPEKDKPIKSKRRTRKTVVARVVVKKPAQRSASGSI
ncbi:hypothetical protein [Paracidovorax cattleyae]|uniref:hypothetical protein n=1 Tax=Paracidovorax cattleyae TaxID=80868 RepID=UPI0018AF55CC|nr:hypothetical protein [Paracidovorax cattleyae]MBF9263445.1 hypothetical protein [Paracidovorax cattleyae]